MSAFTYPGVYIEELPSGVHTITGVATSIAAFVGWADMGPTDRAVLVESWLDFQNQFGGLDQRSLLGYAVNQFFGNGGSQAYIVRLTQSTEITTATGTAPTEGSVSISTHGGKLDFTAKTAGSWSNSYGIQFAPGTSAGTFKVLVVYAPAGAPLAVMETFDDLDNANFLAKVGASTLVVPTMPTAPTSVPTSGFSILSGGADEDGKDVLPATAASAKIWQPGSTTLGFTFTASNPGAWGNLVAITATPQSAAMDPTGTRFGLNILTIGPTGAPTVVESYNNLCVTVGDPFYVVTVLNSDSNYVTVAADGIATKALNQAAPAALSTSSPTPVTGAILTGGYDGIVLDPTLDGGSGGNFMTALNVGGAATGIHLLDTVPIFNLLCVPGESESSTITALQGYCAANRAFYIADSPQATSASAVATQVANMSNNGPIASDTGPVVGQYAPNSAYYFPWVQAPDPLAGGRPRYFPPCGFVAGIYASTDASRGVWKAPAGIDAALSGVTGLQYVLTDAQNGNLNPYAVNCLRQFRVYGDVVWGARTMQGADAAASQWKYVPIRRFALFLESSLYDGTQWAVFEPNDATLWGQLRLNVGSFLQGLFLQGAFQGTTPQQAYFVKCDGENNPQSSIDQGVVNVLVGFAPLYPAEFVVIQIQQMAGQSQS